MRSKEDREKYPRDMIGFGSTPPDPRWPNNAKIALQFVINYEEGGENNTLHGDPHSETFLSEIIGAETFRNRHMSMESIYEYGSRAGFWRLRRLFDEFNFPVTVFGVAMAMERNLGAVEAMLESKWEIASHGYRWISYQTIAEELEREHMAKAIEIHEAITGEKPLGWYTGRDSPNTRRILLEWENFLYDSDSYADDLPYWHNAAQRKHLIVPYTLDNNDMRFASPQGFNSGDQFFTYLKDSFDTLYEEEGKMMSVGLHCRIVGRPGRLAALRRFLKYVSDKSSVWVCTRADIARHWHDNHPPSPGEV